MSTGKITLILAGILLGLVVVLSIVCHSQEYDAERLYYRSGKIAAKIAENPDVVPPGMIAAIEKDMMRILKDYSKTSVARATRIKLAEFYLGVKKFDKAMNAVEAVMRHDPKDRIVMSRAQFVKGLIYEEQGLWDKALVEFTLLRDAYKDTPIGLQIPLYIARRDMQAGRESQAATAYRVAAMFYEKMEKDYRGKELGYAAANFLTRTYMLMKDYENAGQVVENTIANYPHEPLIAQQISNADLIFARTLKQNDKAVEIMKSVRPKLTNKNLIAAVDKRIKELEVK